MADTVSIHDKMMEFKTALEDGLADARKFDEQGNKSAATRITKMLNALSKDAKILRQEVFKIRNG